MRGREFPGVTRELLSVVTFGDRNLGPVADDIQYWSWIEHDADSRYWFPVALSLSLDGADISELP